MNSGNFPVSLYR